MGRSAELIGETGTARFSRVAITPRSAALAGVSDWTERNELADHDEIFFIFSGVEILIRFYF